MNPAYSVNALFSAGSDGTPLYFGTPGEIAAEIMLTLNAFYKGDPGLSGSEAQISSDLGNAIVGGTDGGLFAPESFVVTAQFAEIAGNPTAVAQARSNLGVEVIDCGTFN